MVVVYSQPNCMPCKFTKRRMSEKGIQFREVDVTEDAEALEYVKQLGYSSVPVVVAGETHWSGMRPDMIDSLAA